MFPAIASRTSSSVGLGFCCSSSSALMSMPGVQNPHCRPWLSQNACWRGCRLPSGAASPSTVRTSAPSACTASIRHERAVFPSTSTVHAPQTPCSQDTRTPVSSTSSRRKSARLLRGDATPSKGAPLTVRWTGHAAGMPRLLSRSRRFPLDKNLRWCKSLDVPGELVKARGAAMRRHAVVVGAGTMGAGIALLLAARGLTVRLASRSPESVARAEARLRAATGFLAAEGWLPSGSADTTLAAIQPTTDIDDALARADLVLEAVTEDAAIKREVYRRIGEGAPRSALAASTTSGLDVFAIAEGFPAPERLIIAHFWNPPYLVPLVEVVP